MSTRNNQVILTQNIHNSPDYTHVINFNQSAMYDLCVSNAVYIASDFSFIRQFENTIKVSVPYNSAMLASYIAIRDTSLSSKVVFGWIDKITYISDSCVQIQYTVDYWATWRDRLQFNRVFIERQHTQNDVFGANRQAEPIQVDSYITNAYGEISANPDRFRAIFAEERIGDDTYISPNYGYIDAEHLPHTLYEIDAPVSEMELQRFSNLFGAYVVEGHGGSLLGVSLYHSTGDDQQLTLQMLKNLDGYTPLNKKTLQSPFCVTKLSNNFGSYNILKPELFVGEGQAFRMLSVNCGVGQSVCRPFNYAGMQENFEQSVSISDYPQVPTPIDSYSTWMGQNKVLAQQNAQYTMESGGLNALGSLLSGNIGGAIMGVANAGLSASQIMRSYYNHPDNAPDSVIGRAGGSYTNMSANKICYTIEMQSVPKERAQAIDEFFSRWGYAVNEIDLVRTNNPRFSFHYVKVGGTECAVQGAIPRPALDSINRAFRAGITIHANNTMSCDF